MTIATNNGVPIIRDGKVVTSCNCCGGWSCYKPGNSCSSLIQQISNTVAAVRLSVATQSLAYTRTAANTLAPVPFAGNVDGCGSLSVFYNCEPMVSSWTFYSQNILGTAVLSRATSGNVPGQVRYSATQDSIVYGAVFQCINGHLIVQMGASRDLPGALSADVPGCGDSFGVSANGKVSGDVQVALGTPSGALCEISLAGISGAGIAANNFNVQCGQQAAVAGFLKPLYDGAFFYQDLYKPALLDSGPMTATLELL